MNKPSPAASIKYSGQWSRRLFNACEVMDALCLSAVLRESRVERHAAIDEQRGAIDVVGIVGSEPDRRTRNVDGLADSLVRNERHQLVIGFFGLPGCGIDWCPNGPGRDAVDANATRGKLLGEAFHQQHDAAFRCRVIGVSSPRNELVHRAHEYDLAGRARSLRDDVALQKVAYGLASAQELARQVDADDRVPLRKSHFMEWGVALKPGIVDEDVDRAELFQHAAEHLLDL